MTILYTNGDFISLTAAQFASYSLIRYSTDQPALALGLGFTTSGIVDFSVKLGLVAAHIEG